MDKPERKGLIASNRVIITAFHKTSHHFGSTYMCLTVPLFPISQSEAVSAALIPCEVKSLICCGYHGHLAKFG